MSYLLKLATRNAVRTSRIAQRQLALSSTGPALSVLPHSMRQVRFYADKKDEPKDDKYKSILNDDLLEKAGLNSDEVKAKEQKVKDKAKKVEKEVDEELFGDEEGQDEFSRAKQRRNNTQSTMDKKKERYAKLFWYSVLASIGAFGAYLARDWDPKDEPDLYNADENGYTPGKMWTRFRKRVYGVSDVFNEPAFTELLPPPPPEPYRHPLTLVVELDDTLVHSAWDRKKGWKTAKRPGVDYFLGYLSQYYEIVVFTKSSMAFAEPTITKLDPYHAFISYSLYREVCRIKDGKVIKDLSMMNRPLEKMVMVDCNPDSASMQPENLIPMDKWQGKKDDKLIALIPFLEYIATQPVKDVRTILASFDDRKQIPLEFARREQKLREEWAKEQKEKQSHSFLANLLGIPPSMRYQRKMPLDLIREQGQKNYENMHKYLEENGEKMLQEEQEKTKEMLADQNLTLGKIVSEGMPTAEDIAKQQAVAAQQEAEKAAATAA